MSQLPAAMVKNYTSLIINFLRQATADHCSRDAQNDERQKKLPVVAGSFLEYAFPGSLRRSARITGADPPRNQYTTVKKLVAAKLGASRIRGRHAAVEIVRGRYRNSDEWEYWAHGNGPKRRHRKPRAGLPHQSTGVYIPRWPHFTLRPGGVAERLKAPVC